MAKPIALAPHLSKYLEGQRERFQNLSVVAVGGHSSGTLYIFLKLIVEEPYDWGTPWGTFFSLDRRNSRASFF